MAKFQSKPIVIEANKFNFNDTIPGVQWTEDSEPFVTTIHGNMCYLEDGDWVVQEPDGIHYYPVKPDIFEKRYEPLPAAAANGGEDV